MRWIVLSLLLAVTTFNYLDRLMLSVLSPVLRETFALNESLYGNIAAVFQVCYALGYIVLGKAIDHVGTRTGLAVAAAVWSLASALHATVSDASQFGAWRALLGFSEGANFPACSKAVAEWFPAEERALATGIYNAGVNLASVIGPPIFVAVTANYGWRACFTAVSLLGLAWVAAWLVFCPRTPPRAVNPQRGRTFRELLRLRATWGFVCGKILVDPVWYFLLFWLPLYFRDSLHLQMSQIGWVLPFIYFLSGAGSVLAGWLSGVFLRRGWTTRRARLAVLFTCAVLVPLTLGGAVGGELYRAALLFGVAAAAHQAYSSIAFTIPADVFPSSDVGAVLGLGGAAGAISSVLFSAVLPGYLIPRIGYTPMLLVLPLGYLAAATVASRFYGSFGEARS